MRYVQGDRVRCTQAERVRHIQADRARYVCRQIESEMYTDRLIYIQADIVRYVETDRASYASNRQIETYPGRQKEARTRNLRESTKRNARTTQTDAQISACDILRHCRAARPASSEHVFLVYSATPEEKQQSFPCSSNRKSLVARDPVLCLHTCRMRPASSPL